MATSIPKAPTLGSSRDLGSIIKLDYPDKEEPVSVLNNIAADLIYLGDTGAITPTGAFYFGDNLPILLSLLKQYAGKVRLVYIDPPFAAAGNFSTRNQTHAYNDDRHGYYYIEYIRKRLIVLRELMARDGSIYLHLDQNMAFTMKVIMDEVFGQDNFRNFIIRKKCNPKNFTRKSFGNIADYILFYSKSPGYIFNKQYQSWAEERAKKEYQYVDADGRLFKKVPIHAPGVRNGETGKQWRGMSPPPGKHWQYPPSTLDEMDKNNEIYWSPNGNPRRKIYLEDSEGISFQDIWLDCKDPHNQNICITGYPTEKNISLIERIVLASSNPGDIVLDAFVGSGTTLQAALMHQRTAIGIDNSPEAFRSVLYRFINGTTKMGDFVKNKMQTGTQLKLPFYSLDLYSSFEEIKAAREILIERKLRLKIA
ncbi:MAG: site-specific DNA-methyltransferase [Candidatus Aminicenantes bacterium]|nr:site-specific DNA-methyltransferase [Candidatus Aminicenantes bacterium]